MDSSRKRKTPGWKQSPPSLHMVDKEDQLQQPELLGLYCREARQLSDSKVYQQSPEVCYERQRLCVPQHRSGKLSQIEEVEERIKLRMGRDPFEARENRGRLGRGATCYSSAELKEAARLSNIPEQEEKEACWVESDSLDSASANTISSGFSDNGELDEQESWFPEYQELQAEAIMDLRRHEPWEDFIDDESDEIL